ncbi:MAG: LytTR family DNA-binding domain-containing protein [Chitinophagales bacterium]
MTIRCIAVDDEPPALKLLENFCEKTPDVRLVKTFTRPSEALRYLNEHPVDALFLDVRMPALSGIEFYKQLNGQVPVIFTTAYSEYAVESYNLNAADYLLKPYTYERFTQAISRLQELIRQTRQINAAPLQFIVIKADYGLVKINCEDILFIESEDDYLNINCAENKKLVARMTMKSLSEKLPAGDFLRVHRSFIVAKKKIDTVKNKTIIIGKQLIPISTSYETTFWQEYPGEQ